MNVVPRKPVLSFTRFGDIELAPRKRHLVRDMLGAGEMSCLFGPPGCGKSVLAGDLAANLAAGRAEWFGRTIVGGPVLYLAAERAELVKRRLAAWRRHEAMPAKQAAAVPLAVVDGTIDLLTNSAAADEIIAMARTLADETGQDPALIVVDTLSRVLAGGDENSPGDMGRLVASLHRLQIETGTHIMVVHHTPQDGAKRMRGHGALLGACDTTIAVEKHAQVRTATVDKANDGPEGERIAFTLESVVLRWDGDEPTKAPVVVAAAEAEGGISRHRGAVPPLPKAQRQALDALRQALETDGTPPPADAPAPAASRVVRLEDWRRAAYAAGISSGTSDARRKAFLRAVRGLQKNGRIASRDDLVWLCTDRSEAVGG